MLNTTERILITVRTYPNISSKYIETVCTAGVNDKGEWRRLYPVQLRYMDKEKQYKTFDIVTVKLLNNPDGRLESRRPDAASIRVVGKVTDWSARCAWILPTALDSMRELRESGRSLAPVKVAEVIDFEANEIEAEWTPKQKELLRQQGLFEGPTPLEKIPYDFRLIWKDGVGERHDSKFLAWEVGQAWRNFRLTYAEPVKVLRDKWLEILSNKRNVWFFMGNFAEHRQHFGVCGTFAPPKEDSGSDHLF